MTPVGLAGTLRLLWYDLRRTGPAALLVPPAVLAMGALVVWLAGHESSNRASLVKTVVEGLLPLGAGITVGSVLAAEPAVELQVSVPARMASTVLRRVLLALLWTASWAVPAGMAVFALDWWHPDGGPAVVQLAWLAPAAALAGVATAGSAAGSSAGLPAALVAGVWFAQQVRAGWFAGHRWAQPLFLFPHSRHGVVAADRLAANRLLLLALGAAGLAAGWLLLRRAEERLVTGSAGWLAVRRPLPRRRRRTVAAHPASATPTAAGVGRYAALLGATRYELRMQLGKRSLWIASGLVGGLFLWEIANLRPASSGPLGTAAQNVSGYALSLNLFAGVVFGCLLADRLVRDRQLEVVEILDATPTGLATRLAGKYLGTVAACLIPLLLIWAIGLARLAAAHPVAPTLGYGLAAFAAIELPGLMYVAALALAGPTLLGGPLFRVLFAGYWLWSILSSAMVPSPSGTLLTPSGDVARTGLFGVGGTFTALNQVTASRVDAAASIGLLLTVTALVLAALTARETRLRVTR